MLLQIQKNESLRSYVERNLFVLSKDLASDALRGIVGEDWNSSHITIIAKLLGWHGCYGFNQLLHGYTKYPLDGLFKSRLDYSYSDHEYISEYKIFDLLSAMRSYCPICAKEDQLQIGYSYWRRIFPEVKVCAKHNVVLITECHFCDQPFGGNGHPGGVMWNGCSGRPMWEARPTENHDSNALRFAEFFEDFCQADYHIYIDTAATVLKARLPDSAAEKFSPSLEVGEVVEFFNYIEASDLHGEIRSGFNGSISRKLAGFAASIYETFSEFSVDCFRLETEAPAINSLWDTYCCIGQVSEHFVKENYRLGVAEWSWPAFENISSDPFLRNHATLMWGAEGDCCCTSIGPHRHKHRTYYAALPRVPHLPKF